MNAHEVLADYRAAQDCFETVLAEVPPRDWDAPSECAEWSVRDVVGHTIWGLELVRHLATGQDYLDRTGSPGSERPGELAGADPRDTWRGARAALSLTVTSLGNPAPSAFVAAHPDARLREFLGVVTLDFLAHSWDIGHAIGVPVTLDTGLLRRTAPVARAIVVRATGMFAPRAPCPDGADEQTRWLAFLGRKA
ncbi:TIGR03086 family metal-binding protein [Sciscionella sediminilitoris]|uniref:TIGR03086 family metal-binding protein n=1 Tax=Sciscionella sediminilitoris TaxID=1445613 RepID=UPI0005627396|nr:TIGR03086 family metal-binding protein [Sciscionella sp. SE31]